MGIADMDEDFVARLDLARGIAKYPFVLTSAVRCPKYNASDEVGGSETSSHPLGFAGDIEAEDSHARFKIIHGLIKAGFNRIGIGRKFIHVDSDPNKSKNVIWLYN